MRQRTVLRSFASRPTARTARCGRSPLWRALAGAVGCAAALLALLGTPIDLLQFGRTLVERTGGSGPTGGLGSRLEGRLFAQQPAGPPSEAGPSNSGQNTGGQNSNPQNSNPQNTNADGASGQGLAAVAALEKSVVDAIARAERSVVAISRQRRTGEAPRGAPGAGRAPGALGAPGGVDGVEEPLGLVPERTPDDPDFVPLDFATGVVIDRSGLILTAYHALGDVARSRYWVTVQRRPFEAIVYAADPWLDLAVLKVVPEAAGAGGAPAAGGTGGGFEPIKLGDARDVRRGQFVIALGNPYAIARDGQPSATWGIVSNLARRAAPVAADANSGDADAAAGAGGAAGGPRRPIRPDPVDPAAVGGAGGRLDGDSVRKGRAGRLGGASGGETLHHYGTLIQTDARLALGTSGGALLNLKGEMIGLTTTLAALEGYETSAGFSIPVDDVFRRTLETLKAGKKAEYGFLGVAPELLTLEERQAGAGGVRVRRTVPGTPAARAGLLPDDLITRVAGVAIGDATDLIRELSKWPAESKVVLTVLRGPDALPGGGRRGVQPTPVAVTVELSKKHVGGRRPPIAQSPDPVWRGLTVDFATAVPQFELRSRELDPDGCVAVLDVERDSPAWKAGLRPGAFVSHVGAQRVQRPRDFHAAVAGLDGPVSLKLSLGDSQSDLRTVPAAP